MIIARELGIPAIVGCGGATGSLSVGQAATVSYAEGDTGNIYEGLLTFEPTEQDLGEIPKVGMKIMMNVGNPETAFTFGQLPNDGIGLARLELVINDAIGAQPKARRNYDTTDATANTKRSMVKRQQARLHTRLSCSHRRPRELGKEIAEQVERRCLHHRRKPIRGVAGEQRPGRPPGDFTVGAVVEDQCHC